jgi:phosphoribosylamine--glycine ligase
MKVMVIGSGGRCHAIVKALSKSEKVTRIYAAPGNDGMSELATLIPISATNVSELVAFAKIENMDLTVVGPEVSLAAGVVNEFEKNGLKIFGPTKEAATIESSKSFAKDLMKKYNIPTADFEIFSDFEKALEYAKTKTLPLVLKYDGLAAGKGVVICHTIEEVIDNLRDMLVEDKFGEPKLVIEEFLEGPEFSFMCFVSNLDVYPLVISQDHKRAYENDMGPNTGGMGAYSGVPIIEQADVDYALEHIMKPTAAALAKEGKPFKGLLYGGLMKTKDGVKVIEFNARFGDPETEVVLPRLESDIYDAFINVIDGEPVELKWNDNYTLGIVLASKGYPGAYIKGDTIEGLDEVESDVYHMGTRIVNGKYTVNGGRVLIVVGTGKTLKEAQEKALEDVKKIKCDSLFYRSDIGYRAL